VPSLFKRATSYVASPHIDPAENRLTEIFAAVLDRVPGLPRAVLEFWYGPVAPATSEMFASVHTQRHTTTGGIVDLAIRLRPRRRNSKGMDVAETLDSYEQGVVCWIEIKHRDPIPALHGDQLMTYLNDIGEITAKTRHVLLLAPREFDPSERPPAVAYRTWQSLALWMAEYVRDHGERLGEVNVWLIKEFLSFLKEEGLMDADRITAEHAFIADAVPATYAAFAALWEVAEGVIFNEWHAPRTGGMKQIMNMYRSFDILPSSGAELPATWRGNFLEWGMRPDDFLKTEARNALLFYAGLTVTSTPRKDPFFNPDNSGWLADRERDKFRQVVQWYPRIWRLRYVEELLVFPTLQEQGRELGRWVVAAFKAISATPPPR
jgi:hypothetical protein